MQANDSAAGSLNGNNRDQSIRYLQKALMSEIGGFQDGVFSFLGLDMIKALLLNEHVFETSVMQVIQNGHLNSLVTKKQLLKALEFACVLGDMPKSTVIFNKMGLTLVLGDIDSIHTACAAFDKKILQSGESIPRSIYESRKLIFDFVLSIGAGSDFIFKNLMSSAFRDKNYFSLQLLPLEKLVGYDIGVEEIQGLYIAAIKTGDFQRILSLKSLYEINSKIILYAFQQVWMIDVRGNVEKFREMLDFFSKQYLKDFNLHDLKIFNSYLAILFPGNNLSIFHDISLYMQVKEREKESEDQEKDKASVLIQTAVKDSLGKDAEAVNIIHRAFLAFLDQAVRDLGKRRIKSSVSKLESASIPVPEPEYKPLPLSESKDLFFASQGLSFALGCNDFNKPSSKRMSRRKK